MMARSICLKVKMRWAFSRVNKLMACYDSAESAAEMSVIYEQTIDSSRCKNHYG